MNLLKQLYSIHSPSHGEAKMSAFVKAWLTKRRIPFDTDRKGQVFKLIPGRPIVSCHMDQVQSGPPGGFVIKTNAEGKTEIHGAKDGLGADDKNGIWICLNLLARWDTSFIFSTGEESLSKDVDDVLAAHEDVLRRIPYCLVFDRRGSGDIIATENGYCTDKFAERVAKEGAKEKFRYHLEAGIFSDADAISEHCECVNLSVGYYRAHSKEEYTVFEELQSALAFGDHLLNTL